MVFLRKCASVISTYPSLFASSEILTGECLQHNLLVRNKRPRFWLNLSSWHINRPEVRSLNDSKNIPIYPVVTDGFINHYFLRVSRIP